MTTASVATIKYAEAVPGYPSRALALTLSFISSAMVCVLFVSTILHAFVWRTLFPNDLAIAITKKRLTREKKPFKKAYDFKRWSKQALAKKVSAEKDFEGEDESRHWWKVMEKRKNLSYRYRDTRRWANLLYVLQEACLIIILHQQSSTQNSQSHSKTKRLHEKEVTVWHNTNQTGKEMVLWFAKLVWGLRSHEAECCVSSALIKGRPISLIISSPQNGHSLAIASSSSDRSCLTVRKICQPIDAKEKIENENEIMKQMCPLPCLQ